MTEPEPRPVPPSGREVVLRSGGAVATVVEVGGGLRTYDVAGVPVVDGYPREVMVTAGRGQPLVPWPNRIRGGRYEWDGRTISAPLNEPAKGNAIHGFTRWHNWALSQTDDRSASAALRLHPLTGYPFTLDLRTDYALDAGGLTVTTTARNVGARACPYGHGAHPFVTVGTDLVDDALLELRARSYLVTDEAQIPTGREPVAGTPYDFRTPRRLGDGPLDTAFADLERDADGLVRVRLSDPGSGRAVTVWADASYAYWQVFTGDTVPETERRRRSLAVEPMTCPPNAFVTGEAVVRLEPGQQVTTRWGISPD